jgi:hypothetical protein
MGIMADIGSDLVLNLASRAGKREAGLLGVTGQVPPSSRRV